MSIDVIKIKCDKCGGTNVISEEVPDPPPKEVEKILTMDEFITSENMPKYGWYNIKSHQLMKLKCKDCGLEKEWWKSLQQVMYC